MVKIRQEYTHYDIHDMFSFVSSRLSHGLTSNFTILRQAARLGLEFLDLGSCGPPAALAKAVHNWRWAIQLSQSCIFSLDKTMQNYHFEAELFDVFVFGGG